MSKLRGALVIVAAALCLDCGRSVINGPGDELVLADAGAGLPASCQALVPAQPGLPVVFETVADAALEPYGATSDRQGQVYLPLSTFQNSAMAGNASTINVVTSAGAVIFTRQLTDSFAPVLFPQDASAMTIAVNWQLPTLWSTPVWVDPLGLLGYEGNQHGPVMACSNPRGGMMTVELQSGTVWSFTSWYLPVWSGNLGVRTPVDVLAIGTDEGGNTLVLLSGDSGTLLGTWFDADGHRGQIFQALEHPAPGLFTLEPALGGGLFLRQGTQFIGFLGGLATKLDTRLPSFLRGNGGALVSLDGGSAYGLVNACTVSVFSPDGDACGQVTFHAADLGPCTKLDLGLDGTAIVTSEQVGCDPSGLGQCTREWSWWPAFFGGHGEKSLDDGGE